MLFDLSDPVGTVQMIFSIVVLIEMIQFLDKDDMGAHIQDRIAFYRGIFNKILPIFGKVLDFLKVAGSGFQIIFSRIFPGDEKDQEAESEEEQEGGIEG